MSEPELRECASCHYLEPIRPGNNICDDCGAIWFPVDQPEAVEQ